MSEHNKASGFDALHRDVIGSGLCTACGTCIGICPLKCIEFDYELEEPVLTGECRPCGLCSLVCPGKDLPMPELEKMLFSRERSPEEESLGIFQKQLQGYATDPAVRQAGTSGGCATALLTYALEQGLIDAALCVGMSPTQPWRAVPRLATTAHEILDSAKSKYTLVPVNAMLKDAEERGIEKLGIVALPCQIHSLRKIQLYRKPKRMLPHIEFVIGLFCGSNFPFRATEHLIAKFTGLPLSSIAKLEYRGGTDSQDMYVTGIAGRTWRIPAIQRTLVFMRMRCDRCSVCLDFSAELADVSIGDIFRAGGKERVPNVSAMLVRTDAGDSLVVGAEKAGYIETSPLEQSDLLGNRGVELKKHILPYFFLQRRRHGLPTPDYHREVSLKLPRFIEEQD